jgi:hypothetical protein
MRTLTFSAAEPRTEFQEDLEPGEVGCPPALRHQLTCQHLRSSSCTTLATRTLTSTSTKAAQSGVKNGTGVTCANKPGVDTGIAAVTQLMQSSPPRPSRLPGTALKADKKVFGQNVFCCACVLQNGGRCCHNGRLARRYRVRRHRRGHGPHRGGCGCRPRPLRAQGPAPRRAPFLRRGIHSAVAHRQPRQRALVVVHAPLVACGNLGTGWAG